MVKCHIRANDIRKFRLAKQFFFAFSGSALLFLDFVSASTTSHLRTNSLAPVLVRPDWVWHRNSEMLLFSISFLPPSLRARSGMLKASVNGKQVNWSLFCFPSVVLFISCHTKLNRFKYDKRIVFPPPHFFALRQALAHFELCHWTKNHTSQNT